MITPTAADQRGLTTPEAKAVVPDPCRICGGHRRIRWVEVSPSRTQEPRWVVLDTRCLNRSCSASSGGGAG